VNHFYIPITLNAANITPLHNSCKLRQIVYTHQYALGIISTCVQSTRLLEKSFVYARHYFSVSLTYK